MAVTLSGTELVTDGNMEATDTSSWSNLYGTPTTVEKNTTNPIAGSRDLHIVMDAANEGVRQVLTLTAGRWYRLALKLRCTSGSLRSWFEPNATGGACVAAQGVSPSSPTAYKCSGQFLGGANHRVYINSFTVGAEGYFDDISVQEIVKVSLFSQQADSGSSDVVEASVEVTHPSTFEAPCGVAICMDANDPTKYILGVVIRLGGYQSKVRIYAVNGGTSTYYEPTITYVAGKRVKLTKSGDTVTIYYNNTQIDQRTLTGYSGTIHGLFNTDDDNTLGAYTLPSTQVGRGVTIDSVNLSAWNGIAVSKVV